MLILGLPGSYTRLQVLLMFRCPALGNSKLSHGEHRRLHNGNPVRCLHRLARGSARALLAATGMTAVAASDGCLVVIRAKRVVVHLVKHVVPANVSHSRRPGKRSPRSPAPPDRDG